MLRPDPYSLDTHPKIEQYQVLLIRRASIAERISRMRSLSQTMLQLSRNAITRASPDLDGRQLSLRIVSHHYGTDLAERLRTYLRRSNG